MVQWLTSQLKQYQCLQPEAEAIDFYAVKFDELRHDLSFYHR